MADAAARISETNEQMIAEIRLVQDELIDLGVRREPARLSVLSTEELTEFRESIYDQLRTRKRFLGGKISDGRREGSNF